MTTPTSSRRRRSWRPLLLSLALLAVAAVLLPVVAGSADDGRPPTQAAGRNPHAGWASDVGMEHVHGLGVNPADGLLYAASHFGVFRLDDGTATRMGNLQDTMGFTVVGPDTFLASGHPDFAEDDEPLLGLVQSSDAGRTWAPLSLRGEADFHALQFEHGRVWGYDSTSSTFMATEDRRTWQRLSRLALRDFAVSARDPDVVVATTGRGVGRSEDGGLTWQEVRGAPALVVVDAGRQVLVGVDREGVVHVSDDDGRTWSARGTTGAAPDALTLSGEDGARVFVAVSDGRIVASDDQGRTFTSVYEP